GPIYVMNKDIEHASKQASVSMHLCYEAEEKNCLEQFDATYAASRSTPRGWVGWLILAFVPIVAAWLLAWGLLVLLVDLDQRAIAVGAVLHPKALQHYGRRR